jgi:DNA-3-methyladenine glycosylase I
METSEHRCPWCGTEPLYVAYHDQEWGVPEFRSRVLWEMLVLEGFQAGLNWYTILKKRATFREAFHGFDPHIIANWGEAETLRLLADTGIIRHRGKIEAAYAAARAYLAIEAKQGFSTFVWSHVGGTPKINRLTAMSQAVAQTPQSEALSAALKAEGFKFCGPKIAYAFMQAAGLVNDHLVSCHRYADLAAVDRNTN